MTLYQKQPRISVPYVRARRALAIRAARSIVSFPTSCAREEISPITTAPEENLSMVTSLRMKISS